MISDIFMWRMYIFYKHTLCLEYVASSDETNYPKPKQNTFKKNNNRAQMMWKDFWTHR